MSSPLQLITRWDWDYAEALAFQRATAERVRETGERFLIACSHPHVLTNGRGLQKPRKGQALELTDFDPQAFPSLPFPLYQIERGGGLTFHHPGQLILYPIMRLHPQRLGLGALVDSLMLAVRHELEHKGLDNLECRRELAGLWRGPRKLASIGVAAHHMVTLHGLALNVRPFHDLKKRLESLSPCGMGFDTYSSVEEELGQEMTPQELLPGVWQRLQHAWQ